MSCCFSLWWERRLGDSDDHRGLPRRGRQGPIRSAQYLLPVFAVLLLTLLLFRSLSVEVTPDVVAVWFGPGLIRRKPRPDDVQDARTVRNAWWYGWGVQLTPHGWMFRIGGPDAMGVKLKKGGKIRLGTDEPEWLCAAIRQVARLPDV